MPAPDAWVEVPFDVQLQHHGLRLDVFLARRLHRYSRVQVQGLIVAGRVFLRGRRLKNAARVAKGDKVVIRYPRCEEPPARHDALPVLYEDEGVLAIHKPGDVLSHPTDKAVANTVTSILRRQFPRFKLHLTHRLDRETSGVLVLAKNPAVARALTDQFTRRKIQKEYLALVRGKVPFRHKVVEEPIGRENAAIKVRQAVSRSVGSVPACTEFECLSASESASLVKALPKTGRLHQIRVHLAWLGHPVLGDKLYMGRGEMYMKAVRREITAEDLVVLGARRQMLHAWKLTLTHPVTGRPLGIIAPLPEDFLECMQCAGVRS